MMNAQHRSSRPHHALRALALVALVALAGTLQGQAYRSSVVGTDFDVLRDADPSSFLCLESKGRGPREMPDKTRESELVQEAFVFVAYFDDGTLVDMAIDVDFRTPIAARKEALRYAPRLGKLPTSLRRGVRRVVVHHGERDATAFSDMGLIVLYSENATKRIDKHDLEETLFHESVHAAWDKRHRSSPAWRAAQEGDGGFVTRYAKENPDNEDLAESALLAFALLHHPGRIPRSHAKRIERSIPARIAFVETLLPRDKPLVYRIGPLYACDQSGATFSVRGRAPSSNGVCKVRTTTARGISDIVSNALLRGLKQAEARVRPFLAAAKTRYETAGELLEGTAIEFELDRDLLDAQVRAFLHCNCEH